MVHYTSGFCKYDVKVCKDFVKIDGPQIVVIPEKPEVGALSKGYPETLHPAEKIDSCKDFGNDCQKKFFYETVRIEKRETP